jgi:hypothetical protein
LRSFNQPHQAVYRRRDGLNLARHPGVDFQDARMGAPSGEHRLRIRRSVQASHSTHGNPPSAQEECIRKANALRLPTLRNLLICSGDAKPKGRSPDLAATVALPYLR